MLKSSHYQLLSRLVSSLLWLFLLSACSSEDSATRGRLAEHTVSVEDATGRTITLQRPARRIVALAPHIVENLFTIGAGDTIVGAMDYSDFPTAAQSIPIVGTYASINLEKIIALDPDLIIAWHSGNSNEGVERLRELGFTVYLDQPDTLEDIAISFRNYAVLTGRLEQGALAAQQFLSKLNSVQQEFASKPIVSTFYQVWNEPLQTINGSHIISDAIEVCGGRNIYAAETMVAPVINIESILDRNPQVIIASGMSNTRPLWLDDWQQWPSLSAVQNNTVFFVDPDHIQRHTQRILLGIATICTQLDEARIRLRELN